MDSSEEIEIMKTKITGRIAMAASSANSTLNAALVPILTRLIFHGIRNNR